jgi:hypothetical protein
MARPSNTVQTQIVKLSTTSEVCRELDALAARGLFGKTRSEVAELLMRERLREVLLQGGTERHPQRRPR